MELHKIHAQYITQGYWVLTRTLTGSSGREIKEGFVTDFASIPRILRPWISPMSIPMPSCFHDYDLIKLGEKKIKSRKERYDNWLLINKLLRVNMKRQGRHLSRIKQFYIYAGCNIHAVFSCFIINAHPEPSKTLEDFKGFKLGE